jgi:hypothetical protein
MPFKQTTFKNYKKLTRASNAASRRRRAAAAATISYNRRVAVQSRRISKAYHINKYTAQGRAANKFLRKHKNYNATWGPTLTQR